MNKNFKKDFKTVSLIWLAGVGFSVLLYFILISPQIKLKQQLVDQLADKEKNYNDILRMNQPQARQLLDDRIKKWQNDVNQYVISIDDLAGLTLDISRIAKDSKVESFSITSQDVYGASPKDSGTYISQKQMKVEFKSNFNNFAAFLNALERHSPMVLIEQFSIDNVEHDAMANQVSMIISVYVKKKQG